MANVYNPVKAKGDSGSTFKMLVGTAQEGAGLTFEI